MKINQKIYPFSYDRTKRTKILNFASHCHNDFEIYYLLSGQRNYFIENRTYTIKPGDMVLIPKEIIHKTTTVMSIDHERIVMNVPDEWIPEDVRDCFSYYCLHIPPSHRSVIEDILRRIEYEYKNNDRFSIKLIQQYLYELLVYLTRLSETQPLTVLSDHQDTVIEKAAQYICEHYSEPLTLQVMAKEFSINREYFSQRFKKNTGFGFIEYLNQVRVANAVKLLNTTHLQITEIAYRCGFNDSNYFSTVFKKIKGINPKKYQNYGSKNR